MSDWELVLEYICDHPGRTQTDIIEEFGHKFFASTLQYGSQRKASRIIAKLRHLTFVKDVRKRCPTCGAARTRGSRNVPVFATDLGQRYIGARREGHGPSTHAGKQPDVQM